MCYSMKNILTPGNVHMLEHTKSQERYVYIWNMAFIAKSCHIGLKEIYHYLKPYLPQGKDLSYCQEVANNSSQELNNRIHNAIMTLSNLDININAYLVTHSPLLDKPGAYLLECFNSNNELIAVKVGSSIKCRTRFKQIQAKQEFKKRNLNIAFIKPKLYFPTVEKYGAFTIENFLHRHFAMLGYPQYGNDYFKCSEYSQEAIDNDIPLQIIALLFSNDAIFTAMREMNERQLDKMTAILADAKQTGKFSF